MERNLIDINDNEQDIYRIFTLKRFKELVSTNRLVLVNPSKWDDPFENFFLNSNAVDSNNELISLESIANSWYGQCWTFNRESDALWRIYSPDKDGVRVKTTIKKIFSNLWDSSNDFSRLIYFIGKVTYKKRSEIEEYMKHITFTKIAMGGQNINFAKLLCIKRPEFSHENEVRILINDVDKRIGKNGCYSVDFDYVNVIEEVCVDPRLTEDEFKNIKNKLIVLGCTVPIIQSDLYKINLNPIPL